MMDELGCISRYKSPHFIFNYNVPKKIEDDDILDLDSLSIDSNEDEDTWLTKMNAGINLNHSKCINAINEEMENLALGVKRNELSYLSLTDWDMETSANESLVDKKIPMDLKLESFASEYKLPTFYGLSGNQNIKIDFKDVGLANERSLFRRPALKRESLDKSSILFSIENKLFFVTDADNDQHKTIQDCEIKNSDIDKSCKSLAGLSQEKNYSELKGSEKKKSFNNSQPHPAYHSTPVAPMLYKRRMNKFDIDDAILEPSPEQFQRLDQASDNSTFTKSPSRKWKNSCNGFLSYSGSNGVRCSFGSSRNTNSIHNSKTVSSSSSESKHENSQNRPEIVEEKLNKTYDCDDALSTSSSESKFSSNSSNYSLKSVFRNKRLSNERSFAIPIVAKQPSSVVESGIRYLVKNKSTRKSAVSESKMKLPPTRAPSLQRVFAPKVNIEEEFVSVVEIKSKDSSSKNIAEKNVNSTGPASHIPRPFTRIPVFRTSASCCRTSSGK